MALSKYKINGAVVIGKNNGLPANPEVGMIFYDTSDSNYKIYDGSAFQIITDQSVIGTLNATPTNYTPTNSSVAGHLAGIDSALATAGANEFGDDVFRIADDLDASKKIAFQASGISTATTRTIQMPDADVNLGQISINQSDISTNASNIAAQGLNVSANSSDIADIRTTQGTADGDVNLGIFGGSTISDNNSVKGALGELETAVESKANSADAVLKAGSSMNSAANITFSGGGEVLGLPTTPSVATAAASKAYVDAIATGLQVKGNVRVATDPGQGNVNVASPPPALNGVTLANGDRILLRNQTNATENGIYDYNGAGVPLTRSADQDNAPSAEIVNGVMIPKVLEGGNLDVVGKPFVITSVGTGTNGVHQIGIDNIIWEEFTSPTQLSAGTGIAITSNVISVVMSAFSTSDLAEGTNLYYTQARFDSAFAAKSTTDLSEGTNLYYTQARFDSAFAAKNSDNLSEGITNLFYTEARFDSSFGGKSTTDLAEGTNLYYTQARFDSALAAKSTTNLSEGANLYFTDARARTAAVVNSTAGNEIDQAASVSSMKTYVAANSISQVVEDTTPQLGGTLDLNSNIIEDTTTSIVLSPNYAVRRLDSHVTSNFIEEQYLHAQALLANQTDAVLGPLNFQHAQYEGMKIDYKIKEANSNDVRIGTLLIVTDGTTGSVVDTFTETSDVGISWAVQVNGTALEVLYTSGVNACTMRADVKRILT